MIRTRIAGWLRRVANWVDAPRRRTDAGELVVEITCDTSQFMREIEPVMAKARELHALMRGFGSAGIPPPTVRRATKRAAA